MKSFLIFLSLFSTSLAIAGEVNEPKYIGHISCALENSKSNSFSMTYSPLRTNGSYVSAEAKAELNGYSCWGQGFYNETADAAGMLETKASFPSGQRISQSVLNSYASRMVLDNKVTCSCLVQIVEAGHPRMTEYCRSTAEASAVKAAGNNSVVKGSKILMTKIAGVNEKHTESYEIRTQSGSTKKYFKVVVAGKPFESCDALSVTEIKK